MDLFGIGTAIRAMATWHFSSARRTGRTTMLLNSLKDGDRIVCRDRAAAHDMERKCRARKLNVTCVAWAPDEDFGKHLQRGRAKGRTMFDHSWIEDYYARALERAQNQLRWLTFEASAHGALEPECNPFSAQQHRKFHEFAR